MVLLLRISSWEMIRLVFNWMQGSKRNSFQWSTMQKRIVSVSRVQGRKKIVFSAVQGKKKSCVEIWLQLWQNFCLVLAIIIIIVAVIFSIIYYDGYHVFSYQIPGRSKCGPSESVPLFWHSNFTLLARYFSIAQTFFKDLVLICLFSLTLLTHYILIILIFFLSCTTVWPNWRLLCCRWIKKTYVFLSGMHCK